MGNTPSRKGRILVFLPAGLGLLAAVAAPDSGCWWLCLLAGLLSTLCLIRRRSRSAAEGSRWTAQDVMVGTVRSARQLRYNLKSRSYYAPARFVSEKRLPVTYIALHEQGIGVPPGIKRYARVLTTRLVPRGSIPVAMRPDTDPEEPYYYFTVTQWQFLPKPITIQGSRRGKPRFTTKFLLDHCTHSYQLFSIGSEEEFALMQEIYRALEDGSHRVRCTCGSCRVVIGGGYITVTDQEDRILDRIRLSTYRKKPRASFYRITKHIRK